MPPRAGDPKMQGTTLSKSAIRKFHIINPVLTIAYISELYF